MAETPAPPTLLQIVSENQDAPPEVLKQLPQMYYDRVIKPSGLKYDDWTRANWAAIKSADPEAVWPGSQFTKNALRETGEWFKPQFSGSDAMTVIRDPKASMADKINAAAVFAGEHGVRQALGLVTTPVAGKTAVPIIGGKLWDIPMAFGQDVAEAAGLPPWLGGVAAGGLGMSIQNMKNLPKFITNMEFPTFAKWAQAFRSPTPMGPPVPTAAQRAGMGYRAPADLTPSRWEGLNPNGWEGLPSQIPPRPNFTAPPDPTPVPLSGINPTGWEGLPQSPLSQIKVNPLGVQGPVASPQPTNAMAAAIQRAQQQAAFMRSRMLNPAPPMSDVVVSRNPNIGIPLGPAPRPPLVLPPGRAQVPIPLPESSYSRTLMGILKDWF